MEKLKNFIKNNQNKIIITFFVVIVLLQVMLRIVVGNEKAYLQIDEGYSYGLMNYNKVDMIANNDFYNEWHTGEYYQDYLSISEEEKFDFTPVYENQKNDVHPPFYYLLLRIASSFTIDSFSKWSGIILNIIIFIISSIFIYLIANKIFKNKIYGIFLVLVNGFTLASVESTIFIRMYALNALNILMITYLHIKNFEKENLSVKDLIPMGILIVLGSLTHYYYLVFLFVLFMIYMIHFLRKKKIKNMVKYFVMMAISALVSLAVFPYSFVHIFMGYRGTEAISNLEKIEQMWNSLGRYLGILNNNVFNGILIIILLLVFGIAIYKIIKNKKITIRFENKEFWIMMIPTILYFILIALVSPYQEIRYIMPICPLIIIGVFYFVKTILEKMVTKRTAYIILSIIFIVMLLSPYLFHLEVSYVYKNYKTVVEAVKENHNLPTLYVMNMERNRFMDDLYLFSQIDESYIMDSKLFSEEKLKEIFDKIHIDNGIFVIINEGIEHTEYLDNICQILDFKTYEHIYHLNASDLYQLK